MNIDNLKRAEQLAEELPNVEQQVIHAKILLEDASNKDRPGGFIISQHSDGSGNSISNIYKDGNYPQELYQPIAEFILQQLEQYRDALIEEIENL